MPEHASHAIARYLSMVTWIGRQPQRRTTVGELAEHFGRNLRQIENDLRHLTLFRDSLPGESFELHWFEPPKGTSSAERLATVISVRSTRGLDLPPSFTDEEVATIIVGLRAITPLLDEAELEAIPPTVMAVDAMSANHAHLHENIVELPHATTRENLQILRRAVAACRIVHFTYTARNQVTSQRRVEPLALEEGPTGWHLLAWCHKANDLRLFVLDRMEDLEVKDEVFDPAQRPLQRHESATVQVTLTKDAQWVGESYASRVLERTPHSLTIEIPIWDHQWVRDLLTRVASSIMSISDPQLVDDMSQHAMDVLQVWEQVSMTADGTLET